MDKVLPTIDIKYLLKQFQIDDDFIGIKAYGSGLINHTWKVVTSGNEYILQKVNTDVFHSPEIISSNIQVIANYLQEINSDYLLVAPIKMKSGKDLLQVENESVYRLIPFIQNSYSKTSVESGMQAYEAAKQFGKFTATLSGVNLSKLKPSIPNFHNLPLRFEEFTIALNSCNSERLQTASDLINKLLSYSDIVNKYEQIVEDPAFNLRVTHHDAKISNVLFDANEKGICIIDLDTVMPGYFISDVGDMMRTYLSPVTEEEKDFSKIVIRDDFYHAIVDGYMSEMKNELTAKEKEHFFYAGKFMIYMQALRFATDYLNGDKYYGASYPDHNLNRAMNQVTLLERFVEKKLY
ncbi:MAG TPA: phosphotransferase [Flavisolibacter sp.]|nr:phosphotransferase [Flavisolibacter sp.]